MTRDEVENFFISHGWQSRTAYPHIYYKPLTDYRAKLTTLGVRIEYRLSDGSWHMLRAAYYKNARIENGRLAGLKSSGM